MNTAPERAAEYHQDLGPEPSLSSSVARLFIQRTPAHARAAHPRLTETPTDIRTRAVELGTAVHQILLRDDRVDVLPYDSYRTKDAQTERDRAYANDRVPVLAPMWAEARQIAEHVNGAIVSAGLEPTPFTQGTAEHVIRFSDNGANCRALLDWLRDDRTVINDLKTTFDASPRKFERHLFNMGYDIQAAFYTRAVEAAYGVTPRYLWVVVETKAPYLTSFVELSEPDMAAARVKVDTAIQLWNECLESGVWPGYGDTVHVAYSPAWARTTSGDDLSDVDIAEVPF